jgi:hypothetical protein
VVAAILGGLPGTKLDFGENANPFTALIRRTCGGVAGTKIISKNGHGCCGMLLDIKVRDAAEGVYEGR